MQKCFEKTWTTWFLASEDFCAEVNEVSNYPRLIRDLSNDKLDTHKDTSSSIPTPSELSLKSIHGKNLLTFQEPSERMTVITFERIRSSWISILQIWILVNVTREK